MIARKGVCVYVCVYVCVCACRGCLQQVCLCLCTLWILPEDSLPVVSYSLSMVVWSGRVWEARAGRRVCWINANKVSGVGCDNAVDGDEAGGKDKVEVVKS